MNVTPGKVQRGRSLAGRLAKVTAALMVLVSFTVEARAGSGFEAAKRHPLELDGKTPVLLGNGEAAFKLNSSEGSKGDFLAGTLCGNQWIPSTSREGSAFHLQRLDFASFSLDLSPRGDRDSNCIPLLSGASYDYSVSTIRHSDCLPGPDHLSANLTLSPTENLLLLSIESSIPWEASLELTASPTAPATAPLEWVTHEANLSGRWGGGLAFDLGGSDSFGLALVAAGAEAVASTLENGWRVRLSSQGNLELRLEVVDAEEGVPLVWIVADRIARWIEEDPPAIWGRISAWWEPFWDRSVIDLSGSKDERAGRLESLWVRTVHGFYTHLSGSLPPGEQGFWGRGREAGIRHAFLWPLFQGWIFCEHSVDLRCIPYPLLMESVPGKSGPLLPSISYGSRSVEVGTSGVDSGTRVSEEQSLLFSTTPLLAFFADRYQPTSERTEILYSFLRANAHRAAGILCSTDSADLSHWTRTHLAAALRVAIQAAERIRIDPKSRKAWEECLDSHSNLPADPILEVVREWKKRTLQVGKGQDWVEEALAYMTPDGLVCNASGTPSVLQTGRVLQRLVDAVVEDNDGYLRFLQGIPLEGNWSLEAERFSVPSGFLLLKVNVSRGVVDSFLLRSLGGGTCVFQLPGAWPAAHAAGVGELHETVPLQILEEAQTDDHGNTSQPIASFETEPGVDYLIGPVW